MEETEAIIRGEGLVDRSMLAAHLSQYDIECGDNIIIKGEVRIGRGTRLQSNIELRDGTIIGQDCYIDSGVKMSGECKIGNNVTIRYDAIIARGVEIGNDSYIAPQVMFNNLDAGQKSIGGAKVGERCFIGTNTTLQHGIVIADHTTTGAKSLILKSITNKGETWIGSPAHKKE